MKRIRVGTFDFEGENNVYVLATADGVVLIDTGVANDGARKSLQQGLDEAGYGFNDVTAILLTHWHADHAGLAGTIQRQSDAPVYVHEKDAPLVAQKEDVFDNLYEELDQLLDDWGVPAGKQTETRKPLEGAGEIHGEPTDVTPISDGNSVETGEYSFDVIHAPGHTAGQCCFAFTRDGRREAFVGDALLPEYTPNVGGTDIRVVQPVETYLQTLDRLADADFDRVWPGHDDVIHAPAARARTTQEHHRERAAQTRAIVKRHGPVTPWEVCTHLFGDVADVHILHGVGEASAHLQYLEQRGEIAKTYEGYVERETRSRQE